MPRVFLLKPGSILRDESGKILDARSSVTLVISGERKIVVDTGLEGEAKPIERALSGLGFLPEEIDGIVNTHSHPDHCGNNYLFSRAERLSPLDRQLICPGVWTLATPGHSLDSISIVIGPMSQAPKKADKAPGIPIIVIAGDALPTFGNFQKHVPPAVHVDRNLAISSMNKILALADTVVPGHDYPFSVRKSRYLEFPVQKPSARLSAAQALMD
jgi:glyoxylase-like metal-dependent hydrolase (beta-lactamase superfamily II)